MKVKKPRLDFFDRVSFRRRRKVKWWQATLFLLVVSAAGRFSGGSSSEKKDDVYDEERKPVWSPPPWAFAPAWLLNDLSVLWAGVFLLNARRRFPHRRTLLILQGIHWLIYMTFGFAYFRKKSPILAHVWTQTDAAVATSSLLLARKGNKKLALAYLPLTLWTWFASSLSWVQALYNPDPYLKTEAPREPSETEKKFLDKK